MQNQAEVNFSKWHFNNSQFSKVNLCQKSNWKVKVKLPKSNFRKCNFKRQISNVKFQVEFPTSNFQSEIFQIQFSFKFLNSNFQSPILKVNLRLSERAFQSPLFESQTIPIQTLESETFQSPILTGTFQKPTFSKSSQILVSVRSRADKEEKVWFQNLFAVCVFSQPSVQAEKT